MAPLSLSFSLLCLRKKKADFFSLLLSFSLSSLKHHLIHSALSLSYLSPFLSIACCLRHSSYCYHQPRPLCCSLRAPLAYGRILLVRHTREGTIVSFALFTTEEDANHCRFTVLLLSWDALSSSLFVFIGFADLTLSCLSYPSCSVRLEK